MFSKWLRSVLFVALCVFASAAEAVPYHHHALQKLQQSKQSKQAYSFIVAGDHRGGDPVLQAILNKARDYQPRFMLHTGDFTSAGKANEYASYLNHVQSSRFPVLTALGNHDVLNQGKKRYQQAFGVSDYSFQYGLDRYFVLDNSNYRVTPQQRKWLEAELKKPARYRFVMMHMPPGNVIWFHAFTDGSQALMRIFEKHKVKYVFLGHIHIYDHMQFQGVNYVVSGGAGAPLYRMPLYFSDLGGAYYHFVLVQVSPQGIQLKVIPINFKQAR